jgi:hypothetical protein
MDGVLAPMRVKRAMRLLCIAIATLSAGLLVSMPGALAHDWYPLECCSDRDCAPADTVERREDGSYLVTSRGMSTVIPADYAKWRKSPDGRIHVCIRKLRSGAEYLVCAFRGPGV